MYIFVCIVYGNMFVTVLALVGMLTFPVAAHTVLFSARVARTAVVSHQCFVY